jgi:hypothetical protein
MFFTKQIKKLSLLFIFTGIISINQLFAQSEWKEEDRKKITEKLEKEFSDYVNSSETPKKDSEKLALDLMVDKTSGFTSCIVEKLEAKYPKRKDYLSFSPEEQDKVLEKDSNKWGEECMSYVLSKRNYRDADNDSGDNSSKNDAYTTISINACISGATKKYNLPEERVKNYCTCVMTKFIEKNPDRSKTTGLSKDKIIELMQDEIIACASEYRHELNGTAKEDETKWSPSIKSIFVKSCTKEATETLGGVENAQKYCECMLDKMVVKYPNYTDFAKLALDGDKLSTEIENEAAECVSGLDFSKDSKKKKKKKKKD